MTELFHRNDPLFRTGISLFIEKELVVLSWTIYRTLPQLRLTQFRNEIGRTSLPANGSHKRKQPAYNEIASLAVCSIPAVHCVSKVFCMKLYIPQQFTFFTTRIEYLIYFIINIKSVLVVLCRKIQWYAFVYYVFDKIINIEKRVMWIVND
jgi:hypothetical protein